MPKQLRCQAEVPVVSYPKKGERRVRYTTCGFPVDPDSCSWFATTYWETLVDNWYEEVLILLRRDIPMCSSCAIAYALTRDEDDDLSWLRRVAEVVRHHRVSSWDV